jgi:hypothetical protein
VLSNYAIMCYHVFSNCDVIPHVFFVDHGCSNAKTLAVPAPHPQSGVVGSGGAGGNIGLVEECCHYVSKWIEMAV